MQKKQKEKEEIFLKEKLKNAHLDSFFDWETFVIKYNNKNR